MDDLNGINYVDLIFELEHNTPNLDGPQRRNRLSALSQFQKHCGLSNDCPIEPSLGSNFEHNLNELLYVRGQGGTGTERNLKSHLRWWNRLGVELRARSLAFGSLHQATRYYFRQAKAKDPQLTMKGFGKQNGLTEQQLRLFFRKSKTFGPESMAAIQRLETALQTPKGALTAFSKHVYARPDRALSPFSKRQVALCASPIRLRLDQISLNLSQEWVKLFDHKTAAVVMGNLKRNEPWRLRPISESAPRGKRILNHSTTTDGKQYSATADFQFGLVLLFFGALAQIDTDDRAGLKKYNPADFSLAWMADYDLVKECVDYLVARYNGVYTNTIQVLLTASQVLLHPEFGWVRQNESFGSKLMAPISSKKLWSKWCDQQLELLNRYIKQLKRGNKFTQTRNPFLPIWDYIQSPHPIAALFELERNISRHLTDHPLLTPNARKTLERTLAFVRIITEQPLRLKMFCIMTYFADNTGNLYKRSNGDWAIRFPKDAFKNERGAAQKAYDVAFTPKASIDIERYITTVLPLFSNAKHLVFPILPKSNNQTSHRSTGLPSTFRQATQRFLPRCKGFGPHAARHLIATDFIKNHSSGWQTAADVLHDTLETVRKAYAFLEAEDGYKFYRAYLEKLRGGE